MMVPLPALARMTVSSAAMPRAALAAALSGSPGPSAT